MSAKTAPMSKGLIIHGLSTCENTRTFGSLSGVLAEKAIARFLSKINKNRRGGCWLWKGNTDGKGYGAFDLTARSKDRAHRLSYRLFNGPIGDGLLVCHSCDVPMCVNPAHLFLGTHKDNARDAFRKGRRRQPIPHRWPEARKRAASVEAELSAGAVA